ncbi:MAG: serpin family protein [archaeon]
MKKIIIFGIIIIILCGIVIAGKLLTNSTNSGQINNPFNNSSNKLDDSNSTSEDLSSVVNSNNNFALDLYSHYKSKEELNNKNLFFSPYSISTALAMTYEGAKGQTASEMQNVFYFPEDNTRRGGFARLYNVINKQNKSYQLSTANALWAQKDYKFLDSYFQIIDNYYGGKVTNLDFVNKTEESRITINNWVEDKTNNKIKDLIPQGIITQATRLVLTNAIYFKGNWDLEFEKEKTQEKDFFINSTNTIKAQIMSKFPKAEEKYKYFEDNDLQVLELPYKDKEISMVILLPKDNNLSNLENNLTIDKFDQYINNLSITKVDEIYIPKFKFETKYFMNDDLIDMGMPTAFSQSADFSGMDGVGGLFIAAVIHQAFVEVNEQGTEAAAATAVVMDKAMISEPPKRIIFNANHAFIFLIKDNATNQILFMGRVVDPTSN